MEQSISDQGDHIWNTIQNEADIVPWTAIPPLDKVQYLTWTHFDTRKIFLIDLSSHIQVSNGQAIRLDYLSGLISSIHINYSTPTGDFLVNLSPEPIYYLSHYQCGMLFTLVNPWYKKMNTMIRTMMEVGLVDHWKRSTLAKMKASAVESGNIRDIGKGKPGTAHWVVELLRKLTNVH